MITLLLAIAAASQTPAPVKSSVDVCAEFGDFAYVIMEDVRKGKSAGEMLTQANDPSWTEDSREILTALVYSAFEMNRLTQGTMTPKRFSDEATLECYSNRLKEKTNARSQNPVLHSN